MEEFLSQLMGKKIDVSTGGTQVVSGEVVNVQKGILYLRDESENVCYVAIEKIAYVWESKEKDNRPGFMG